MSAIRNEILNYINEIPDEKLIALKPLLTLLVNDTLVIESNLDTDEKEIIRQGREEYKQGNYTLLENIDWD